MLELLSLLSFFRKFTICQSSRYNSPQLEFLPHWSTWPSSGIQTLFEMSDKPLPSFRSLLDMSNPTDVRGTNAPFSPYADRRYHRASVSNDHYALPYSHHRSRASTSNTQDIQVSSSARARRSLDMPYRPPSSSSAPGRSLMNQARTSELSRLPSVSEVLGIRRDPHALDAWHHPPRQSYATDDARTSHADSSVRRQGYPCERCGRMFTRKSDAQKHIKVVHDKVKNFACVVCGRRFGRKDYCTVSFSAAILHSRNEPE